MIKMLFIQDFVFSFSVCTSASSFRYNGLSVVYFVFLLTLPLLPNPSPVTLKGEELHVWLVCDFTRVGSEPPIGSGCVDANLMHVF